MRVLNWIKSWAPALVLGATVAASSAFTISQPSTSTTIISGVLTQDVTSIVITSTVAVATLAQSLGIPNGDTTLSTEPGGVLVVTVATNSTAVYVVSTNGAGYNGPIAGTIYSFESDLGGACSWSNGVGDPITSSYVPELGETIFDCSLFTLAQGDPSAWWQTMGAIPATLYPGGGGSGTLTLAWLPITNTTTIPISSLVGAEYGGVPIPATDGVLDLDRFTTNGQPHTLTLTNLTTLADGVLGGTNGIYFTKSATNYWILLP